MRKHATESQEQKALIEWTKWNYKKYPELEALYSIPNAGRRTKGYGKRMKAEGMKAGVSDLHLPVPKGAYCGLWVEMKSKTGKLQDNQKEWLDMMRRYGHKTAVCYGAKEAISVIVEYLNL